MFLPQAPTNSTLLENYHQGVQMGCWGLVIYAMTAAICSGNYTDVYLEYLGSSLCLYFKSKVKSCLSSAILQKYLDNFDLSIKVIYILGTLGFSIGKSNRYTYAG